MQLIDKVRPAFVNLDTGILNLKPIESPFLKNYRLAFGKDKQGKQGGNLNQGKKMQSNWQMILLDLPKFGINKPVLFGEADILNEAYVGVWNSLGEHTIYVMYGNTMTSEIVYRGPNLDFVLDPKNFVAPHRAYIRLIYDVTAEEERHVREKIFIYTDGHGWQRWINVLSSVATGSFNAAKFPYFKLHGPHYDADEFIDYPVRPPMFAPVITALPRTEQDKGKQTLLLNKATQLAYRYILTDGRASTLSPHSNPFYVSKTSCSSSKVLTRALDVAMNAGSALVERIQVLVKNADGIWMLYDTIDKFDSSGANAPSVIGDAYWKRTNPWSKFLYNEETNTIHYTYMGDLQATAFPKNDALDFQNDVPIRSYALTPAGDSLLWCNNLYHYDNLPTETLDKFDFTVKTPQPSDACKSSNSKIVLYAFMGRQQRVGGGVAVGGQVVWQIGDSLPVRFGALNVDGGKAEAFIGPQPDVLSFDQSENDMFGLKFGENDNFMCYLAGTPYTAIGVQYAVDANGAMTKVGKFDAMSPAQLQVVRDTFKNRGYFVQRFEFNVPSGKYIARLARHDADISSNYSATSTYVVGVIEHQNILRNSPDGFLFKANAVTDFTKEFRIDASAGDVDLWNKGKDLFYILVPLDYNVGGSITGTGDPSWRYIEGYVLEDPESQLPMEQLNYDTDNGKDTWKHSGELTDHNGFFFAYTAHDDAYKAQVRFNGYYNCGGNKYICKTVLGSNDSGFYAGTIVSARDTTGTIADNNRISIKGKVVDCATGLGIPSVGVTLTQSKTFFTNSSGEFEILAHDTPNSNRVENIYFNTGGECTFKACDCGPIPTVPFTSNTIPCISGQLRSAPAITVQLKVIVQSGRGLKEGGRYGFGGGFMDLAGRTVFVQKMKYVDIPTFLETGILAPSTVQWSVNGKLNLPDFVKYFTFFRTGNRNAQTYLQWVGDKISYLDNKGNTVLSGSGAIRAKITMQSLLDFNIKNNFNTNVTYQFVPGDIMRIYDDGDNNLFDPKLTDGYLDYQILGTDYNQTVAGYAAGNVSTATQTIITDPEGKVTTQTSSTIPNPNVSDDGVSLVIEFDERLLKLKDKTGFWLEIIRPKDLASIEEYTEIIGTVPVVDGEPVFTSGELDTYDSYFQNRFIRIPNALGKSLGHPFVSPSISDYWGKDIASGGRRLIEDPQAKQTWHEDDVMKTDEIVNEGRVNGLGRCRTANRKNFKGQSFGGIVAAHAERNSLVFICEHDWFRCDYDMNYVKVTSQGLVQATLDQNLSDPYPKQPVVNEHGVIEKADFGCAYEDTATIIFDGSCYWADRFNSTVIELQGFSRVKNIGEADVQSYFINKFNEMAKFNSALSKADYLANLVELCAGLDPQTGEYNLTFRPRMGLSTDPQYFVNDEREVFYDMPETFIYNPDYKQWVTFAGYTPECYGKMPNARSGMELITFAAGAPWFHNSVDKKGSMNFYGIQTGQVIETALNIDEDKVKIYQNLIISSADTKYFADRVITDDPKAFSYIPLAHFKRKEKVLYAPFLRNMASYPNPNKPVASLLADGGRVFGKTALVRLVSDPNNNEDYGELNGISYRIAGSERSAK
jgi:hypothetical protein